MSWSYADGALFGYLESCVFKRKSSFAEEAFGLAAVAEDIGAKHGTQLGDVFTECPWERKRRPRRRHGGAILWNVIAGVLICIFLVVCALAAGLIVLCPVLTVDAETSSTAANIVTIYSNNSAGGRGDFSLLIDNPSIMWQQIRFSKLPPTSPTSDSVSDLLSESDDSETDYNYLFGRGRTRIKLRKKLYYRAQTEGDVYDNALWGSTRLFVNVGVRGSGGVWDFVELGEALAPTGVVAVPYRASNFEVPMVIVVNSTKQVPYSVCENNIMLAKVNAESVTVHTVAGAKSWYHMASRVFPLRCTTSQVTRL